MRKGDQQNLTLTGHADGKRSRKKWQVTSLMTLSEWMAKQEQRGGKGAKVTQRR